MIEIWGTASNHGSTDGAARGALCCRQYETIEQARDAIKQGDWLEVLTKDVINSLGEKR
jgi:flavin-binding protein dodecin